MHTWLIVIGVVVLFYLWFSNRTGATAQRGILSFGKSRAREAVDESVTFNDVAGVDEAKEELQEVVDFLSNPDRYAQLGARIPKGVLLVGPPGTGKTLLARAVAGEADVPFFHMSGSDFVEMFVGVGAARVRDMFDKARENAPCIIFIDELDALGKARGVGLLAHDEREQTLNQLLVEMDGFDPSTGVILMAATNRPEILDAALLRPGRFDRHIMVDGPSKDGRRQDPRDPRARRGHSIPSVDLRSVAARTPGFAGADLANLVNEAALLAARQRKTTVTMAEFDEAIERVMRGPGEEGARDQRRGAPHRGLPRAGPRGGGGGAARRRSGAARSPSCRAGHRPGRDLELNRDDRYWPWTATQLQHRIAVLLGGRAAEVLFLGEASTGAQNDLARATDIASDMVRKYGMSELGLRTFERPRAALVNTELTAATPRRSRRRDRGEHRPRGGSDHPGGAGAGHGGAGGAQGSCGAAGRALDGGAAAHGAGRQAGAWTPRKG